VDANSGRIFAWRVEMERKWMADLVKAGVGVPYRVLGEECREVAGGWRWRERRNCSLVGEEMR